MSSKNMGRKIDLSRFSKEAISQIRMEYIDAKDKKKQLEILTELHATDAVGALREKDAQSAGALAGKVARMLDRLVEAWRQEAGVGDAG